MIINSVVVMSIFMYYFLKNAAWIKRNLLKCIKMCTFYIQKNICYIWYNIQASYIFKKSLSMTYL